MSKSKSKGDLVKEVAYRTKFLKGPVEEILNALDEIIQETIINGDIVRYSCFEGGTKLIKKMEGTNPRTGEKYIKEEHYMPYVKMRAIFKEKYKQAAKENEKKQTGYF